MAATSREEALRGARKLIRGFSAAPDPGRHAQRIYADLVRASGWSPAQEAEILALGHWLQTRPAPDALQQRFVAVLERLR